MGIQRLSARLSGHGSRRVFEQSIDTDRHADVNIGIVDGPGLAHHIYYQLCDQFEGGSQRVSYEACSAAAVTWLETLTHYGFRIEAVMFDGALPITKQPTRKDRLQSSVDKVQTFRRQADHRDYGVGARLRNALPPPPFLISAVVEGLLNSSFATRTFTVPGEADPFCIVAANRCSLTRGSSSIFIFSEDSDFLVYRTGDETHIVPFREVCESTIAQRGVLTAVEFCPYLIANAKHLAAPDLLVPAYFMSKDMYCSFDQAVRLAKGTDMSLHQDFKEFESAYDVTYEEAIWSELRSNVAMRNALSHQDARLSELVHQVFGGTPKFLSEQLNMFLPFLLEDQSRGTAWKIAADLRTVTYTLLVRNSNRPGPVFEHRRSGLRIAATTVELLDNQRLALLVRAIIEAVSSYMTDADDEEACSETDTWRYCTMRALLKYLHQHGYSLPTSNEIAKILTSTTPRSDWQLVHLTAQYQAVYYSFRMLFQALAVSSASQSANDPYSMLLLDLQDQLATLPGISTFFSSPADEMSMTQTKNTWKRMFPKVLANYVVKPVAQDSGKRNAKTTPKPAQKLTGKAQRLANNMFSALAD